MDLCGASACGDDAVGDADMVWRDGSGGVVAYESSADNKPHERSGSMVAPCDDAYAICRHRYDGLRRRHADLGIVARTEESLTLFQPPSQTRQTRLRELFGNKESFYYFCSDGAEGSFWLRR